MEILGISANARPVQTNYDAGIEALGNLGLTGLQAKIYCSLLEAGRDTASNLACLLAINRVDTYRVLRTLHDMGLVEVSVARPTIYIAIPPKEAINVLVARAENRVRDMKSIIPDVLPWLASLQSAGNAKEIINANQGRFVMKTGKQIYHAYSSMINSAQTSILKVWSQGGLKFYYLHDFFESFEHAKDRGVKIQGIVEVSTDRLFQISELSKTSRLRQQRNLGNASRYMIIDESEILINITNPNDQNDELLDAIWTDNEALVKGFVIDFNRLWNAARPLEVVV